MKFDKIRIAPRHPTVNFIWYKELIDEDVDTTVPAEGISRSCDISKTGLGLYTANPLTKERLIFVEMVAKEFNLSAVGKIVHVKQMKDGLYRAGIHFLAIPPTDRRSMNEFLRCFREKDNVTS